MTTCFRNLPVGANFEFRGRRYQKLALSLACDEERIGNVFHDETEVVTEPRPGFLRTSKQQIGTLPIRQVLTLP